MVGGVPRSPGGAGRLGRCTRLMAAAASRLGGGRAPTGHRRYDPAMRYGLALPNFTDLGSTEAIEAAADAADRLGFESVWTTDHVLVDRDERRRRLPDELRRDPDAGLGRREASGARARDVGHRRATAERSGARQGARDARRAVERPADRRGRRRLERAGVREPRRGRPVPRPRRLPRRDDRALAAPLVRVVGAVRGAVPLPRRLRLRAAAGPALVAADLDRRAGPRRPSSGSVASRTATTPRRRHPRHSRSASRRSATPPTTAAARCRRCRPASGSPFDEPAHSSRAPDLRDPRLGRGDASRDREVAATWASSCWSSGSRPTRRQAQVAAAERFMREVAE